MRRGVWGTSLGLALGLLTAPAFAGEGPWQLPPATEAAATPAAGGFAASRDAGSSGFAADRGATTTASPVRAPAVTLDRPVPAATLLKPVVDRPGVPDGQVQPAAFTAAEALTPNLVARGRSDEPPRAMPLGPAVPGGAESAPTVGRFREAFASQGQGAGQSQPIETAPAPRPLPGGQPDQGPGFWGSHDGSVPAPDDGCGCGPVGPDGSVTCGPDGCGLCVDECGSCRPRFYFSAEGLIWWTKQGNVPALVTTGPAMMLAPGQMLRPPFPGALGSMGTTVLFGDTDIGNQPLGGVRFNAGWWFGCCKRFALDTSFFFLNERQTNFTAGSGGMPLLTRPFNNTMIEDVELVAFPGALAGSVTVTQSNRFWGGEVNLRKHCCDSCWHSCDCILGFRYLGLDDNLTITESLMATTSGTNRTAGDMFFVSDRFTTRNRFYGGQIGWNWECRWGRWSLDWKVRLGIGGTQQVADIRGSRVTTMANGGMIVNAGSGLLAQPTNSGRFSRDMFTFVPECGVNLSYQFTDYLRGWVGYNFLYWSDVLRPGEQIDRVVNRTQLLPTGLVGVPRPAFSFKGSDFWAQGVNLGLEFRY